MKRLCTVLFLTVLMVSMLGASPALAQTGQDNEEEVNVSTEGGSENQTAPSETPQPTFAVNTELMEELDRLVKMLEEAEHKGDKELVRALQEKIQVIKEEISKAREEPEKPQLVVEKPSPVAPREVTVVRPTRIDRCAELEAWESKKKHYEALYALSEEELKDRGYRRGKEEIGKIIEELEEGIRRLRKECEAGVTSSGGGGGAVPAPTELVTIALYPKPVAVESGEEITDYYKVKIAEIAVEEVDVEKKIANLKELRNEIDKLIEELIKSKDEISTKEVSGLVTEIEVKPGEVKMDKVVVKTVAKSIATKVNNKELKIKPTKAQVIIRDGNLEIKAPDLTIKDEVLKVGDSEVKLTASDVVEKIKIEPKEIELKEENAKAVYKIKTDEDRKLLGFIPVKVEKTLTADASSTEVEIIKEAKPWWAFLTTK